jgi:hypothetical protein
MSSVSELLQVRGVSLPRPFLCRTAADWSSMMSEESSLVCQVDYEETRLICLRLAKDGHNRLWPQPLGEPPEILQPDETYTEQSLGQLLNIVKPTYAAKRVLGVILARSFLHLLGGPWILRSFCIDDISVFCRLDRDRPYPIFDKVFLSTNSGQPSDSASRPRNVFSVHPFPDYSCARNHPDRHRVRGRSDRAIP